MEKKKIRRRDQISALISVSTIFIIGTSLCIFLLVRSQETSLNSYKDVIEKKYDRQESFRQKQRDTKSVCDSLYRRIERFDPKVNASFEENDIKFLINDLKEQYNNSSWDKRNKVFYQISSFYDMWFADKKVLWTKKSNINTFKSNLERCEMGLSKKEDELKSK